VAGKLLNVCVAKGRGELGLSSYRTATRLQDRALAHTQNSHHVRKATGRRHGGLQWANIMKEATALIKHWERSWETFTSPPKSANRQGSVAEAVTNTDEVAPFLVWPAVPTPGTGTCCLFLFRFGHVLASPLCIAHGFQRNGLCHCTRYDSVGLPHGTVSRGVGVVVMLAPSPPPPPDGAHGSVTSNSVRIPPPPPPDVRELGPDWLGRKAVRLLLTTAV
jgi:hypothetical protein